MSDEAHILHKITVWGEMFSRGIYLYSLHRIVTLNKIWVCISNYYFSNYSKTLNTLNYDNSSKSTNCYNSIFWSIVFTSRKTGDIMYLKPVAHDATSWMRPCRLWSWFEKIGFNIRFHTTSVLFVKFGYYQARTSFAISSLANFIMNHLYHYNLIYD